MSPEQATANTAAPRICVPLSYQPQGGMYTFIRNLLDYMERHGIPYTQDIDGDYDILFVNSWAIPYEAIKAQKAARPGLRVTHRIDGSGRDYGRTDDADNRQARVNMLADVTIFQSRYSKLSTTAKFNVIQQDGPTIYNPVDHGVFRPDGETLSLGNGVKVCNASFSTNRMKGTWKIGKLAWRYPNVTFVLCGRYPELPELPNILMLGHLETQEMAKAMRSCDVFMHLAENDPCPNVVTEALASGLPVLYADSGGTPELVGECGATITEQSFGTQLESVLSRSRELSEAARSRALEKFSPDRIFPKYLEAMAQGERHPLPSRLDFCRATLRGYPVWSSPRRALGRFAPGKLAARWRLS